MSKQRDVSTHLKGAVLFWICLCAWPTAVCAAQDEAEAAGAGDVTLPEEELEALVAREGIEAARTPLRRAARSAASGRVRAEALRLLAKHDVAPATGRICARSLRIDVDERARRAAAECLGRLGPAVALPHLPDLVAATHDPALDVVTMSGWALATVGDASVAPTLLLHEQHQDPRVAAMFRGFSARLSERIVTGDDDISDESRARKTTTDGLVLVPGGILLGAEFDGLSTALAASWLGVGGAAAGWLHGALLTSAYGGPAGAELAPLTAMGLALAGGSVAVGYAFVGARQPRLAHTVVQLGGAGLLLGYGAGSLSGADASGAVAAAQLALVGTLAGTGIGVALVHGGLAPSWDALGTGLVFGAVAGLSTMSIAQLYLRSLDDGLAAGMVAGGLSVLGTTLLLRDVRIGLLPILSSAFGAALLGGTAAVVAAFVGAADPRNDVVGYGIASSLIIGAGAGAVLGSAASAWWPAADALKSPDVGPNIDIAPPTFALLRERNGHSVPGIGVVAHF